MSDRCEICEFWFPCVGYEDGVCRRYPPPAFFLVVLEQQTTMLASPLTPWGHWCGEFNRDTSHDGV